MFTQTLDQNKDSLKAFNGWIDDVFQHALNSDSSGDIHYDTVKI